jgi:hypothetical protein
MVPYNLLQVIKVELSIEIIYSFSMFLLFVYDVFFKIATNVLQLQEVGDFGDENCLPPLNLIRSTKLHLTTEPPISCSYC